MGGNISYFQPFLTILSTPKPIQKGGISSKYRKLIPCIFWGKQFNFEGLEFLPFWDNFQRLCYGFCLLPKKRNKSTFFRLFLLEKKFFTNFAAFLCL